MHLCTRIALLVAIASVAKCTIVTDGISRDHETVETHREGRLISHGQEAHIEGEEISQEYETDRDGRRINKNKGARLNFGIIESILGVIDFESGNCSMGSCMSQKDCNNMNGTDTGDRCVQGFGVCCVTDDSGEYEGGDLTISGDGGNFFNPASTEVITRQEIIEEVTYKATVIPADDDVQIKVYIKSMDILGPTEGDCGNSSLMITGTNPGPEIPVLCGVISEQTLYLDIDNTDGPIEFAMRISSNDSASQTWDIFISFLKEVDAVPRRCLQYHTATNGTIHSFNYQADPPSMMLNYQTYSICFGYVVGYCDIAFNFARLDLGRLDGSCTYNYLLIGDDQTCGDFADLAIKANATGPINIGVRSGAVNEIEEEGFSATYMMMGC